MKIAIINTLPVPSGNASVNRFLGYGKCLVQEGVCLEVLSTASFNNNETDGVKVYSCGVGRGHIGALRALVKKIKKNDYNAVIIVSNSLLLIYPIWITCKIRGIK